jgi:hypothetical protein
MVDEGLVDEEENSCSSSLSSFFCVWRGNEEVGAKLQVLPNLKIEIDGGAFASCLTT